jgi:bacillithiol biosynthesis cysteine-adding enzyme BshC
MRDFFAEYVSESPELMGFFARPAKALFASSPKTTAWDASFVEALTEYNAGLGGRPLFLGDETVVITGQQPGLFTGPLYTVYKAITAILLSKKIHDRFGARCVPVFWIAGDDHDFEEVRSVNVLSRLNDVQTFAYSPEANVDGLPMSKVPLEPSLHTMIDDLASSVTGSEFRDEIARFLHESLEASSSLSDWTARIMSRLFRDTPLIMFTPEIPAARKLAASVLEREVRDPLVSTMLLNDAGQRLRALDFHQQVVKGDTECNFFLEVNGKRCKIVFENEAYCAPEASTSFSIEELTQILHSAPERFTPNVALRCIAQQHLFPAAAYVAGPGEIAYWAQLKPLFRHFGKEMPIVYPRSRCMITNAKCKQIMADYGFTLEDVSGPVDALHERALRVASRAPAQDAAKRGGADVLRAIEAMAAELDPLNSTAAGMARKFAERAGSEFERIERAIAKADEEHVSTVRKQVQRVCSTLFPSRKPQERILNIFSFLFEYGWGLIPRLMKEIDAEGTGVKEIEL